MTIREEVAESLNTSNVVVKETIVTQLVKIEIDKRVTAVSSALTSLDSSNKELSKLNKPDLQTFDSEGKVLSESFSKDRVETRKKLKEQIAKIDLAIKEALENNNFEKVFNLKG
jgi:hypothetical protein